MFRIGSVSPTVLLAGVLAVGCAAPVGTEPTPDAAPAVAVSGSRADVPAIVVEMIEAHGGYETWRNAPSVHFRDTWWSPGETSGSTTVVNVEQGARRAWLEVPDTGARVGWDGERAWSVGWTSPAPPRFMALLNYYFLNLPWLTLDPGVHLEVTGTGTLLDDPTEYVTVRMTFGEGVGDTPDDWYRLYIHPESKRLAGTAYVVTYDALLPEGVASTAEHVLVFRETTTVGGLVVPTAFSIHEPDGSDYAACTVEDWDFTRPFDATKLDMPEGAVIDTSRP